MAEQSADAGKASVAPNLGASAGRLGASLGGDQITWTPVPQPLGREPAGREPVVSPEVVKAVGDDGAVPEEVLKPEVTVKGATTSDSGAVEAEKVNGASTGDSAPAGEDRSKTKASGSSRPRALRQFTRFSTRAWRSRGGLRGPLAAFSGGARSLTSIALDPGAAAGRNQEEEAVRRYSSHTKWCKSLRRARQLHQGFAVVITVLTVVAWSVLIGLLISRQGAWKMPPAEWCSVGTPSKIVSKATFQWVALMYLICCTASCPVAVVLMRFAASSHLLSVARYVGVLWLGAFASYWEHLCHCNGLTALADSFYILHVMSFWTYGVWLWYLVYTRVRALEKEQVQELGSNKVKRCMQIVICIMLLGLPNQILPDTSTTRIIRSILTWATVCSMLASLTLMVRAFATSYRSSRRALYAAEGRTRQELLRAKAAARDQIIGGATSMITAMIAFTADASVVGLLPFPIPPKNANTFIFRAYIPQFCDYFGNVLGALLLSGALTGALHGGEAKRKQEARRHAKRRKVMERYNKADDAQWQSKVEELALRGFTLQALLDFYKGLGGDYMLHFDPNKHTTHDVVRQAIIPLSRETKTAYSSVMMDNVPTRPDCMVTHNWGNLFRDLVACIIADALNEAEFGRVAYAMDHHWDVLEHWLEALGKMNTTFWVCAFSVSQHDGICGANPDHAVDTVTGEEHPVCDCGKPKYFNADPPVRADGNSILCEMNKFDDMMCYLAANDKGFRQIIAVDRQFVLFSRAWCVAELAAAHEMGMVQNLKVSSADNLDREEQKLHNLKVREMKASRPEDVQEILNKIADKDEFDRRVQELLFGNIFACWRNLDTEEQLKHAGRMARWESIARLDNQSLVWHTTSSKSKSSR